jgi:hypothetical protein
VHVIEALGRASAVVEANDVDKRRALVLERRLNERLKLRLIAGEAAPNKRGAEPDRRANQINWLDERVRAFLAL